MALKIESPDIQHKVDVGGVVLGLNDGDEVCEVANQMLAQISEKVPDADIDGFLLQKMAPPETEMVIGMRKDPIFGPIVMVGLGGVFVEVLNDIIFARVPLTEADALDMLENLDGKAMLDGARGKGVVNCQALARTLVAVGTFARDHPEIEELDLNPVFAGPDGIIAVDWLVMAAE